jgi:uncharacterized membrane protein (UPF0127 family)
LKQKQFGLMIAGGILSVLLMVGACGSNSTAAPTNTPTPVKSPKPVEPIATPPQEEIKTPQTTASEPQTQSPATEEKPADNPRRLYQLHELETVKIKIDGEHEFTAWIMDTDAKRAEGMMYLVAEDYKPHQCMLFVFPDATERGFWMANCYADLDIAYLSPAKKILTVATMKAMDQNLTPSKGKAMYALEFKPGLLKRKGIKAGMKVTFEREVKSKD